MTPRDDRSTAGSFRSLAHVGYLGFAMAVPVAAGAWLGSLVDRKTGGRGIFVVLGILLGVAAGALSAYRVIAQVLHEGKTKLPADKMDHDGHEGHDGGTP